MNVTGVVRIVFGGLLLLASFLAGQQMSRPVAAQGSAKWEYQIVGSIHTVDQLNKLGDEGWEAVTLNASNRVLMRRSK